MADLTWDYSDLAKTYHKRAPYSKKLIESVLHDTGLNDGSEVCDVGAGTGFLAREFAAKGLKVKAIEPNKVMRETGIKQCQQWPQISWFDGTAEKTGQFENSSDMVSFGSSFNVVDKYLALSEAFRVCRSGGWFLALWNHRDINDGLQFGIERLIKKHLPNYDYGSRREDQGVFLKQSGYFSSIQNIKCEFIHEQSHHDVISAWHSHGTLQRQAGNKFSQIVDEIASLVLNQPCSVTQTKFLTQAWLAQFKTNRSF